MGYQSKELLAMALLCKDSVQYFPVKCVREAENERECFQSQHPEGSRRGLLQVRDSVWQDPISKKPRAQSYGQNSAVRVCIQQTQVLGVDANHLRD